MEHNDLKRLSRTKLLEMLIEQTREAERLNARILALEAQAEDRRLAIGKAGSIAEASLQLNGVFEAAQRAADQYLENVRLRSEQPDEPPTFGH